MPKSVKVKVNSVDTKLEFSIQTDTKGKQLFDMVTAVLNIKEHWWFGLQYTRERDKSHGWVRLADKISSLEVAREEKDDPMIFNFRIKHFPESISEELIQLPTLHLFYLEMKESILEDKMYCPVAAAILLSSLAFQVKYGDYKPDIHKIEFFQQERLLPERITNQYLLTKEEWTTRIIALYAQQKFQIREEAMMKYLKIVEGLDMYGVQYYSIKNKKNSDVWLGVDPVGFKVYEKEDKLTVKMCFPWTESKNIATTNKKFIIKHRYPGTPDFVFHVSNVSVVGDILDLSLGYHDLYYKRRKPENGDVAYLKMHAKEEREKRKAQHLSQLLDSTKMSQAETEEYEHQRKINVLEKLQSLEAELVTLKLQEKVVKFDIIHDNHIREGADKDTIMRRIRMINMKQQIDNFNVM